MDLGKDGHDLEKIPLKILQIPCQEVLGEFSHRMLSMV
jgi:hypothetical protein